MTMYERDDLESVFEKGYIVKAYTFRRLKEKKSYQYELSQLIDAFTNACIETDKQYNAFINKYTKNVFDD